MELRPYLSVGIDYRRLRRDILAMREAVGGVRESAESSDGLITATVDGRGRLVDLVLDPRVYRDTDSGALSQQITSTVRCAAELAAREVESLARTVLRSGAADRACR